MLRVTRNIGNSYTIKFVSKNKDGEFVSASLDEKRFCRGIQFSFYFMILKLFSTRRFIECLRVKL